MVMFHSFLSTLEGKPPFSIIFLWFSHECFPIFLWKSWFSPFFLWFSYGFPMVFRWFSAPSSVPHEKQPTVAPGLGDTPARLRGSGPPPCSCVCRSSLEAMGGGLGDQAMGIGTWQRAGISPWKIRKLMDILWKLMEKWNKIGNYGKFYRIGSITIWM